MNYKIVSCSLKISNIQNHINKYAKEGWKYKTIFTGSTFFGLIARAYIIMER